MNDTMMQALQHQKHAWALRHEMGFPADHKLTPSIEFGTGGAIDGGIVCELVLRAMERDQDIIYAGQAHAGMSEPHEYLAVMRNQHLIHVFRCRPWSGDSNAPVILVSEYRRARGLHPFGGCEERASEYRLHDLSAGSRSSPPRRIPPDTGDGRRHKPFQPAERDLVSRRAGKGCFHLAD